MPPVSPCGYGVLPLRTAYRTRVRFYRDDPRYTTIQWYRVPVDRPWLPVPTVFTSWDWDHYNEFRDPFKGEVIAQGEIAGAARTYTDGQDPTATVFNESYCGKPDEWTGEVLTVPPDPLLYLPPGPPDCCKHGPVSLRCPVVFAAGAPLVFRSTFSAPWNGFGIPQLPIDGPDGAFPMVYDGFPPCHWTQATIHNFLGRWSAGASRGGKVRKFGIGIVTAGPVPLPAVRYETEWIVSNGDLWDGYTPRILHFVPGSDALFPFWDWPPIIVVEGGES